MAKKAKRGVKKRTTKKKKGIKRRQGRPEGSKSHIPKGLEVKDAVPLTHANSKKQGPGYRRVTLITLDPDHAKRLRRLVVLVRKKDPKLFNLLEVHSPKKKS